MKKTLSVLLSLLMLVSALPMSAVSAYANASDFESFTDGDQCIISDYKGSDENVVIPDKIDGVKVCQLAYGAFKDKTFIKSVTLPESIEYIGNGAFSGCTALESVTLPEKKLCINGDAFKNTAIINDSSKRENGVLYIGRHLIEAAKDISGSYSVKANTLSVADQAFQSCKQLTEIILPKGITVIGDGMFYNCTKLESVKAADKITELQAGAFCLCSSLKNDGVDFSALEKIGDYAIEDSGIDEFYVSPKLASISSLAFYGCNLKRFTGGEGNSVYSVKDGVLFADGGKTLLNFPTLMECDSYTIPEGVTEVGDCAFCKTAIKSITIPEGVEKLGSSAFQEMNNITEITIPDSVSEVEDFTFYNCASLKSVKLGNGLKTTSYQMFMQCNSLKDIDFGSVETVGAQTFRECEGLESIELPESVKDIEVGIVAGCTALKSFKSAAIDCVPYQTFWGCTSLTDVELNEGVENIYRYSFYKCNSLKSIELPETVKFVHNEAFPEETEVTVKNSALSEYGNGGFREIETVKINVEYNYDYAYKVLEIVNEKRAENGLGALTMNEGLLESAMKRAEETTLLFSHTRPESSLCFTANKNMYAENIAAGQMTPEEAMESWMNSRGHRANILTADFKTIGIGCIKHNGIVYWVQCFGIGNDAESCEKPENYTALSEVRFATEPFEEATQGGDVVFSFGEKKEPYSIAPYIYTDSNRISLGETQQVSILCKNPEIGFTAKIDNSSAQWSVSDSKLTLNDGSVTANAEGESSIIAKLSLLTLNRKMTVYDKAKEPEISEYDPETGEYIGSGIRYEETNNSLDFEKTEPEGYSYASNISKTKLARVKLKSAKGAKRAFTVKWKKVKRAGGYEVRYSLKRNMKKAKTKKVSAKKASLKVKKLKRKKTYYVQVRAYKKSGGKTVYGKWSKTKKVRVK